MTSSTATHMCDRLVSKGLVARQERPEDRRAAWVTLTPAGRDLAGEVMHRRRETIADLSLTRSMAFATVLHAIVESAGEIPDTQWWQRWEGAAAADLGSVRR